MISIVTAKVIRANAQYAYKLKGKGEKYLVKHQEKESAADIVVKYLTPYVVENAPLSIESVVVQKSSEVLNEGEGYERIYKCSLRLEEELESGKVHWVQRKVFVSALSIADALKFVEEDMSGTVYDYEILSVQKTNIIEIISRKECE